MVTEDSTAKKLAEEDEAALDGTIELLYRVEVLLKYAMHGRDEGSVASHETLPTNDDAITLLEMIRVIVDAGIDKAEAYRCIQRGGLGKASLKTQEDVAA